MDAFLEPRWRHGRAPFETTLQLDGLVPLAMLRELAARAVESLAARFGAQPLRTLHDWHEHDGIVTSSRETSWAELARIVASTTALAGACALDDRVRLGFYSPDGAFYLRVHVTDEDGDAEPHGDLDLSGPADGIDAIERELPAGAFRRADARAFFTRRHAG